MVSTWRSEERYREQHYRRISNANALEGMTMTSFYRKEGMPKIGGTHYISTVRIPIRLAWEDKDIIAQISASWRKHIEELGVKLEVEDLLLMGSGKQLCISCSSEDFVLNKDVGVGFKPHKDVDEFDRFLLRYENLVTAAYEEATRKRVLDVANDLLHIIGKYLDMKELKRDGFFLIRHNLSAHPPESTISAMTRTADLK